MLLGNYLKLIKSISSSIKVPLIHQKKVINAFDFI